MGHVDPWAGPTRPEIDPEAACPPPGRVWEVALGAAWTPAELNHVADCPKCREAEGRVRAMVTGGEGSTPVSDIATTGRPISRDTMTSGFGPHGASRWPVGGSDAWTPDPRDATITRSLG